MRFYIDMMMFFGWGFATDPQYPWIAQSLSQDAQWPALQRADGISVKVERYLESIAGENQKYRAQAEAHCGAIDASKLEIHAPDIEQALPGLLKSIHPGRAIHDDDSARLALISASLQKARIRHAYTEPAHQALFVLLAYLYGHQFDEDPFLSFELPRGLAPSVTTERLESLVRQWADPGSTANHE